MQELYEKIVSLLLISVSLIRADNIASGLNKTPQVENRAQNLQMLYSFLVSKGIIDPLDKDNLKIAFDKITSLKIKSLLYQKRCQASESKDKVFPFYSQDVSACDQYLRSCSSMLTIEVLSKQLLDNLEE